MILYPKELIYFIHIPKNGGASMLEYAKTQQKLYIPYKKTHSKPNEKDLETFQNWRFVTIVRNTYERIASLYRFRCLIRKTDKYKNFEDFVLNFKWKNELFNQINYIEFRKSDTTIVRPKNLEIIIYNKKSLADSIAKVFGDENSKMEDKKLRTEKTHYYGDYNWKEYYTDKAREHIEKICKKEIEEFNFKF